MKVTCISLDACDLPIGLKINLDGQVYKLTGIDGDLIVWRAYCPECGNSFEAKTTKTIEYLTRRCKFHRKSGVRVKDTRLSQISQRDIAQGQNVPYRDTGTN